MMSDRVSPASASRRRRLSFRLWMQETLYQTGDAGDNQTANAGVSPFDSGCRRLSIRQQMQETLYQTADAGDSIRQRM